MSADGFDKQDQAPLLLSSCSMVMDLGGGLWKIRDTNIPSKAFCITMAVNGLDVKCPRVERRDGKQLGGMFRIRNSDQELRGLEAYVARVAPRYLSVVHNMIIWGNTTYVCMYVCMYV